MLGYLHYDSEGAEPELHRICVDPGRKRGGVGSALMGELHARLPPGGQYILLVAEANKDAQAFYERHGLVDRAAWMASATTATHRQRFLILSAARSALREHPRTLAQATVSTGL